MKRKADDDELINGKPKCKYFEKCYRKNPDHLKEFTHPSDVKTSSKSDDDDDKKKNDSPPPPKKKKQKTVDDLPPCPYGAACYRKNIIHFAEYSHPIKSVGQKELAKAKEAADEAKANDKSKDKDSVKSDWTAGEDDDEKDGPQLQRSYSSMSEEEKIKMIEEAFKLKKQLKEKEKEIKKREEDLKSMKKKLDSGILTTLEGEEEAMKSGKTTIFKLTLSRLSKFGDVGEFHYRYAESQFLRLMGGQAYHVTQVDYVVNPPLVKKYQAKQEKFKDDGKDTSHILGFHGTSEEAIDGIIQTNFSVSKLGAYTGDKGFYGAGIYFSEYTSTSLGYNRASRMLLSKVLIGKQFQCPGLMMGAPLKKGYDSHLSPCGTEVVIYDSAQILPCYIVHFSPGHAKVDIHSGGSGASIETSVGVDKKNHGKKQSPKTKAKPAKKMKKPKTKKGGGNKVFVGLTFCVTGKFDTHSQASMKALLEKHGGNTAKTVNKTVTHLVCAALGTAKADKAESLGIPIVSEQWVLDSIEEGEPSEDGFLT